MFAPYCSHCQSHVLLGPRRIVRFSWVDGDRTVVLRCHCGRLVDALGSAGTSASAAGPASPGPSSEALPLTRWAVAG